MLLFLGLFVAKSLHASLKDHFHFRCWATAGLSQPFVESSSVVLADMDTSSDASNKLVSRTDSSVLAGGLWGDEQGIPVDGQLFFVTSYR